MKILIVRHGEPNYEIDGLTEKGQKEAEFLADRLCRENIAKVYCSPLGRARLTAEPTLKRKKMEAEICPWLKEFDASKIKLPYKKEETCCWDLMPRFVNGLKKIYSPTEWLEEDFIKNSDIPKNYKEVCHELDALLARHGYERNGNIYNVKSANHDTIILVCHFGLTAVLLSHLLNCSPYSIWQHTCTAPTAVTTIYTEEREEGIAHFRAASIGDTSHLYAKNEESSFAARFCECFTDDTRH
jgi:probable phosphoglycerate mutase